MAKKKNNKPSERAVKPIPFLQRLTNVWGHPGWLAGERWRRTVANQPVAQVCRDTLLTSLINIEWAIVPKDPEDSTSLFKEEIQHYEDLFNAPSASGEIDFDGYVELVGGDVLDLPFGGMAEVGRENDDPEGRIVFLEHVDGATLAPTLIPEFPVVQYVPGVPTQRVIFPDFAVDRLVMTPRTEFQLMGWGMAPPEKIYLAITMLFRGDAYYAGLLIDTPEAGILDLGDMKQEDAEEWLDGFRSMFRGIDGFKIPVMYEHTSQTKWIPFGRSPQEMLMDTVTHKYAQLTAAGYGLRLSDIGLEGKANEKTLAGVIRGERQSRRTGYATIRSKFENHFNRLLKSTGLKFIWIDKDSEDSLMRSRALMTGVQAMKLGIDAGIISIEEARQQIVADGNFTIDIDPDKLPEPPEEPEAFGAPEEELQEEDERVLPSAGGRGEVRALIENAVNRILGRKPITKARTETPTAISEILSQLGVVVDDQLGQIIANAGDSQLKRLIRAATKEMLPNVQRVFPNLDNEKIQYIWLPQMQSVTLEEDSSFSEDDLAILRAQNDATRAELDRLLQNDLWWQTADETTKNEVLTTFKSAFEFGLFQSAVDIVRALYEGNLRDTPELLGISFDLVNPVTLAELERAAVTLVRRIDEGTRFYIKNSIITGVRKGFSSPDIANAIRNGENLEAILDNANFINEAIEIARNTLAGITNSRANSIVNTEINRAENAGRLEQFVRGGLTEKRWQHLGKRGTTAAGNEHPCPICTANEAAGIVPIDFQYLSVFKDEKIQHPPGHPGECHCRVAFIESDLFETVGRGDYTPWTGN